ncbi:MAG: OsmC family protein [Aquificae bacterium]|nr:OsmC family protein [Aquificota bacterium]
MEEKKVVLTLSEEGTYRAQMPSGEIEVGKHALKPMELLLTALAGCSGVDVETILRKKRQPVEGITIEVKGTRRDKHPKIYESIEITYKVKGEVEEKALQQAIKLSIEKYCSVYAMLKNSAKIEVRYEICRD